MVKMKLTREENKAVKAFRKLDILDAIKSSEPLPVGYRYHAKSAHDIMIDFYTDGAGVHLAVNCKSTFY